MRKKIKQQCLPAGVALLAAGGSRRLCLLLQVSAAAVVRASMGIDRRRLQIGMAERLRDERDWRTVVDSVRGMRVPQPMRRRSRIDASAKCSGFDDVVEAALGERLSALRAEDVIGRSSASASSKQALSRAPPAAAPDVPSGPCRRSRSAARRCRAGSADPTSARRAQIRGARRNMRLPT